MDKIEFFKSLGFSDYESKTLSSFIKLNSATPKEISFDSGVPQNKLYSIIKEFEKLGILALIPSETKKYQLINFQTLINNKINQMEKELREIKKNKNNFKNIKNKQEQFVFSLIRGQKTIMNKLAEHNPKLEKEVLGVQRNWKYWGKGIREMEKAIKRGVRVKFIGIINKETEKRAKEWKKIGCEIRKYNQKFGENPLRFSIFDNKEVRITIGKPEIPAPENYITIWTTSKPIIAILRKQFLEMWNEGEKF